MKNLIITLILAFVCVSAQRGPPPNNGGGREPPKEGPMGDPWRDHPGCNRSTYPMGVNITTCCPTIPKCLWKESLAEICKQQCPKPEKDEGMDARKESWCCWSKCILAQSGVIAADGTFDGTAAKQLYKAQTTKPSDWEPVINKVVDDCIAKGPQLVEEFKNKTRKNVACDTAVSQAISFCIKRNLFISCPASLKNNTANCTKLFEFADACPAFGMFGGRGKGHGPNGPKGGNDENKGKGKNEKKGNEKEERQKGGRNKKEGKQTTGAPPNMQGRKNERTTSTKATTAKRSG